jgi:integrase
MPRRSSGPHLWFDEARKKYTIIDGRRRSRTGFGSEEAERATAALADYIASQHQIKDGPDPILADVLTVYAEEHLAGKPSESHVLYDIAKLTAWWGANRVSEINSKTCKDYVAQRKGKVCARRELAFLNAAIKYWHKEHSPLNVVPTISRPAAPEPRSHWMTREQAARFLWKARHTKHLARFFIIGWYTGTRRGNIGRLSWDMIDLKTGIMHRRPPGTPQPRNKQAPPVRMGKRLMAHMRRWKRLDGKGAQWVVAYRGKPISRPVRSWDTAREAAKLPTNITPHILRHTRTTNMMRHGVSIA